MFNQSKSNPSTDQKLNLFLKWIEFNDLVESVLKNKGFKKVITPFLVTSGAMESQLEPFEMDFEFGAYKQKFQLPTSPEFHLKKALSLGLKDVFEIKSCFRNHELSDHHSPEFTMLEFYKNDIDLDGFIDQVKDILNLILTRQNHPPKFETKTINISDLFKQIGFDLSPDTSVKEIKKFALSLGLTLTADDSFDDAFFRIWLEKIEPYFDFDIFTIVKFYPPSQAALSKINNEGWADRFEIYWKGMELGNAFCELTGSKALKARWTAENSKRVAQGKSPHPLDLELISLNEKLPACCGIAFGLDRLFMAINGLEKIDDFKLFSRSN